MPKKSRQKRRRDRRRFARIYPKGFMVEKFPVEGLSRWLGTVVRYAVRYTSMGQFFVDPPSKPYISESHGLHWFTLIAEDGLGIESIGFEIHHNLRADGGARAEAYLRLVPAGRRDPKPYKTKNTDSSRKHKTKRPRQARQIIGRSNRRF